jgi:hypothetical protein
MLVLVLHHRFRYFYFECDCYMLSCALAELVMHASTAFECKFSRFGSCRGWILEILPAFKRQGVICTRARIKLTLKHSRNSTRLFCHIIVYLLLQGIIQGILPPVALALLFMLLPPILRCEFLRVSVSLEGVTSVHQTLNGNADIFVCCFFVRNRQSWPFSKAYLCIHWSNIPFNNVILSSSSFKASL